MLKWRPRDPSQLSQDPGALKGRAGPGSSRSDSGGPGRGRQAGRATAFRSAAARAGSRPDFIPLPARLHTRPSRAAGPQAASPASTLPPQSPESPSPWQQPEKGPAKIFMAPNSSEASDGGGVDVIPSLLAGEVTDMQGSWVGGPRPLGQGSQRKIPRAASRNRRREEAVCDRHDRWMGLG